MQVRNSCRVEFMWQRIAKSGTVAGLGFILGRPLFDDLKGLSGMYSESMSTRVGRSEEAVCVTGTTILIQICLRLSFWSHKHTLRSKCVVFSDDNAGFGVVANFYFSTQPPNPTPHTSHFCEEHETKIKEELVRLLSDLHTLSPGASYKMKRRLSFKLLLPLMEILWSAGLRIVTVWLDDHEKRCVHVLLSEGK